LPDSLDDKLRAVATEIVKLEKQITEILDEHDGLSETRTPIPTEGPWSEKTLTEAWKKLSNFRQAQLSYFLASISESSNRLETATKNLKESSESQVKITESQVRVLESQAQAIDDLLRSSHRLEQFALFLIVLTALNIFVVEQSIAPADPTLKTIWLVLGIVSIVALTIFAYRWPLMRKDKLTKNSQ
jgi:hypothetical protein